MKERCLEKPPHLSGLSQQNHKVRRLQLQLQGFRNHSNLQLEIEAPRLLVIGSNGVGKSNLLESVELLGSLRSHRSSQDGDLIHWDANHALIDKVRTCVQVGEFRTRWIEIMTGLSQGSGHSPEHWSVVFDRTATEVSDTLNAMADDGVDPDKIFTVKGIRDALILYVDDLLGQVMSAQALQQMAAAAETAAIDTLLMFDGVKTKILVAGADEAVRRGGPTPETTQHWGGHWQPPP